MQVDSIRPMFEVFRTIYLTAAGFSQYDVTAGGSRFVLDSVVSEDSSAPLSLVQNWTADLKKKLTAWRKKNRPQANGFGC